MTEQSQRHKRGFAVLKG